MCHAPASIFNNIKDPRNSTLWKFSYVFGRIGFCLPNIPKTSYTKIINWSCWFFFSKVEKSSAEVFPGNENCRLLQKRRNCRRSTVVLDPVGRHVSITTAGQWRDRCIHTTSPFLFSVACAYTESLAEVHHLLSRPTHNASWAHDCTALPPSSCMPKRQAHIITT